MIEQDTQLHFVRQVLYDLKQRYPSELDIYQFTSNMTDPTTGKRTATKKVINVRKAILLPASLARKFIYDRSYMAADKNYTFGGFFDVNMRLAIIDSEDVPVNFDLTIDDYIVVGVQKYEIKGVISMINNYGYMVTIKETKGSLPYSVIALTVNSCVRFDQMVINGP